MTWMARKSSDRTPNRDPRVLECAASPSAGAAALSTRPAPPRERDLPARSWRAATNSAGVPCPKRRDQQRDRVGRQVFCDRARSSVTGIFSAAFVGAEFRRSLSRGHAGQSAAASRGRDLRRTPGRGGRLRQRDRLLAGLCVLESDARRSRQRDRSLAGLSGSRSSRRSASRRF
jgi:hypothetical protein